MRHAWRQGRSRRGLWSLAASVSLCLGCAAIAGLDDDYAVTTVGGDGADGVGGATHTGTAHGGGAAAGGAGVQGGAAASNGAGLTDALQSGDVQLYYGQSTNRTPQLRIWDADSRLWSPPEPLVEVGGVIHWVVAPEQLGTPQVVGVLSADSSIELSMLTRAVDSWRIDWTVTGLASENAMRRGVDVENEDSSGAALAVYSDNTGVPKYRTLDGADWSVEQAVFAATKAEVVQWVELVPRRGTDEIALLYSNQGADLEAVIWNGSSWSAPMVLETDLLTPDYLCFAAEYEALSGDLLAVWSHPAGGASGFYSASLPAGGSAFDFHGLQPAPLTRPGPVRLRGDVTSDRIGLAYVEYTCGGDDCDDFTAAMWNGAQWTDQRLLDPQIHQPYHLRPGAIPVDLAWAGAHEVVALYTENGDGLDWARWTVGSGWQIQDDWITAPLLGARVNILGLAVEGRDEALILVSDVNRALYAKHYDGASGWADLGAGLESSLSSLGAVPFDASMKR